MPGAEVITREELKRIMGGQEAANGTCCWHTADWDAFNCGIDKKTAMETADQVASETGNRTFWCCDSC